MGLLSACAQGWRPIDQSGRHSLPNLVLTLPNLVLTLGVAANRPEWPPQLRAALKSYAAAVPQQVSGYYGYVSMLRPTASEHTQ